MTERFLLYSLRRGRPVKAVWMEDGALKTGNITVTALDENSICYVTARARKQARRMERQALLACGYARGDSGDTDRETERTET